MGKLIQPTKYTGVYPYGWAGFTWLDRDAAANAFHPGDDYNWGYGDQDYDQPVYSIAAGKVVHTSNSNVAYGNILIIEIPLDAQLKALIKKDYPEYKMVGNTICTLFAHLNRVYVKTGQSVAQGQLVATVGNSGVGLSNGHLHAEIYEPNGELVDKPYRFYPIGWTKEHVQQCYLPFFILVEKSQEMAPPPNADPYVKLATDSAQTMKNATQTATEQGDTGVKTKLAPVAKLCQDTLSIISKLK